MIINKKYTLKWEKVKKNIFLALADEKYEEANTILDEVSNDIDFNVIPTAVLDTVATDSPATELLVLLAHKKIFFTKPPVLETIYNKIIADNPDLSVFNKETQNFIALLERSISSYHSSNEIIVEVDEKTLAEFGPYEKDLFDSPGLLPRFISERTKHFEFIDKLISLGADPFKFIPGKGSYCDKVITLDSEIGTQHLLKKTSDEQIHKIRPNGGDLVCLSLAARANKSFKVIIEERGDIIDFKKQYPLMFNNNLLHVSFAYWMPEEAELITSKGASLTQRNSEGKYPADLIPEEKTVEDFKSDKGVYYDDSILINDKLGSQLIPANFKFYKALPEDVSSYYKDKVALTKAILQKERKPNLSQKYSTVF